MSRQSKRATKRKKTEKMVKKKKKMKKLGLSRFIPKDRAPSKKATPPEIEKKNQEKFEKMKANSEAVKVIKQQRKDLTHLERCKLQMASSYLRLMDEKLYTSDSRDHALSKEEFLEYHKAYSKVCDNWPTKPSEYLVRFIKKRLFSKKPAKKWKIADIGCGEKPLLKMNLPSKCRVSSFDLISTHKDVIEANMDSLPLENESVHCAVYSLSLMAKHLGNIFLEAKRVLKLNGSLLIVEVTSRFEGHTKQFIQRLERIGFKKQSMKELKPNGYFTFFHFSKLDNKFDYPSSFINIHLKPCVYKAR